MHLAFKHTHTTVITYSVDSWTGPAAHPGQSMTCVYPENLNPETIKYKRTELLELKDNHDDAYPKSL